MMEQNSEYWEERIANETWKTYNDIEEKNIDLLKMYDKSSNSIKKELLALAEKAEKEGALGRTEQYRFNKLLGQQGAIFKECERLGEQIEKHATSNMNSGGTNVYKNVMESLGINEYTTPNKKTMENMMRSPWKGSFFSERLWRDMGQLERNLNGVINDGISTGKTITEMAVSLSNIMNSSFNDTHRLVRTETINHMNRSALQGYKDAGVKEIQWWAAVDERTCPKCGAGHSKPFDIDKAPILPCHPGCRCTWLPVIESMSKLPSAFEYTKEKQTNITSVFNEILIKSKETGYEYMNIIDYTSGKPLYKLRTDNKTNSVSPSLMMITKMKIAKENSLSLIHNHPRSTPFSASDVITLNNNKSLAELIIIANDETEYFISVPKDCTIDLSTKQNKVDFKQYVKSIRIKYLKQGYDEKDSINNAWEEIAKERGWLYGRRRK